MKRISVAAFLIVFTGVMAFAGFTTLTGCGSESSDVSVIGPNSPARLAKAAVGTDITE